MTLALAREHRTHHEDQLQNTRTNFERLYPRVALVLSPQSHRIAVLAQGGLEATIHFLGTHEYRVLTQFQHKNEAATCLT